MRGRENDNGGSWELRKRNSGSGSMRERNGGTAWRRTAMATLLLLSACATRSADVRMVPRLDAMSPDRAAVGNGAIVQVTVTGAGFDSLNTLHFGALVIPGVPRTGPGTLRFTVPLDDTFLPNRGGAPLQPIAPGTYPVIVETARGRSNALVFTLQPGTAKEMR